MIWLILIAVGILTVVYLLFFSQDNVTKVESEWEEKKNREGGEKE